MADAVKAGATLKPLDAPYRNVFKRYELKYLLNRAQYRELLGVMVPSMEPDRYSRSSIRNVYFDTPDFRLIRRSLEHPVYKEKLRVRSYGTAAANSPVFVELKKKYQSVVYKRRISLPEREAMAWLGGEGFRPPRSQIAEEIDYVLRFYPGLRPTAFLSYEREAFSERGGGELRITFDTGILCRRTGLSLREDTGGTELLGKSQILLEVKTSGALPLWLTHFLARNQLYKTSFSKYGTAYQLWQREDRTGVFHYA